MPQPSVNDDLHGSVPDSSPVAVLLVDVINDLEFAGGERLLAPALRMAKRVHRLKERAKRARVPVIYANDNFGRWRSDFRRLVAHCLLDDIRGRPVVELLTPDDDDYFVLKPKHSAFYHTTLDLLLDYLHVRTLILTGMATEQCVLFTANDAYMRDLILVVPSDCVASSKPSSHARALSQMKTVLRASTTPSRRIDFAALKKGRRRR